MTQLSDVKSYLDTELPALLERFQVPGAAVAVSLGGEVIDAAAGVLSRATGVEATPDSVFQIGSITKVWTTTLVMQLVDEGLVELDAPLRRYLPEFRIADEAAAAVITVRQMLSHTAGFEGDIFTDTGRGDDCIEKYVATLGEVPQLFAPGEMFSYNNAAFCTLGRLIEVLRGKTFDDCVRDHLFTPLGLTHAANGPYEAIMFRAAIGHLQPGPEEAPVPAPVYALARSNAAAGSMLAMRPRDLITFAQMHLAGGVAADGTRVLSAESVAAMQQAQIDVPELGVMGNHWGLGWELFDWPDGRVIGHDGGTIGQSAFLRIAPERDLAVALLTNGGATIGLYLELYAKIFADLADMTTPTMPNPPAEPARFDAARYVGTYVCDVARMTITQDDDGRIWMDTVPQGELAEMMGPPEHKELVPWQGDSLIHVESDRGMYLPIAFVGDDGAGHFLYLHHGRAVRREGA